MSYGLSVLNSSGDVVIDADFRNHAITASGTATTGVLAGWTFCRAVKVTLATPIAMSRSPLIWGRIGTANQYMGLAGLEINASSELTGFWLVSDIFYNTTPTRTINWRVSCAPVSGSSETWGFHIFDASGNRVFDSGLDYLDIRHVVSGIGISDSGQTYTHTALTNPWFCLSSLAVMGTSSPSGDDTVWQAGMVGQISTTQTRVALNQWAYEAGDIFYSGIGWGNPYLSLVLAQ